MTMEFTVRFSEMKGGALSFTMGNGNTVANNFNNDGRNDNHFLWDLAIVGSTGSLWYMTRTGTYQDTGYVLTRGASYHFVVQVNATNSALDGVVSNTMRLFINRDMVSDSLPVRGATSNANGFRIGARNATSSGDLVAELDDIRIWNGITAIPEPSIATLSVIGSIWFVSRRRRSTAQVNYQFNTSIPG
jgi:hypothetical protein